MLAECVVVEERHIPPLKSMLARRFYSQGLTQRQISSLLHITQPMVSKYLSEKKEFAVLKPFADTITFRLKRQPQLSFHALITSQNVVSSAYYLSTKEHILTPERQQILASLKHALESLHGHDFSSLIPSVKINMAACIPLAKKKVDVAAIPGGLIFVQGKLTVHLEPEFGASNHLASLLLLVQRQRPIIAAIINLKYNAVVQKALSSSGIVHAQLGQNYSLPSKKKYAALIHRGSFGIEPTLYILGKDAGEVAECCVILQKKMH